LSIGLLFLNDTGSVSLPKRFYLSRDRTLGFVMARLPDRIAA
jgi:hypothetical protein